MQTLGLVRISKKQNFTEISFNQISECNFAFILRQIIRCAILYMKLTIFSNIKMKLV